MKAAASKRLRVVLDTNVLVSALGFKGRIRKIWDMVEQDEFDGFVSPFILAELERNLIEQADLSTSAASAVIDVVKSFTHVVNPQTTISVIPNNNPDNRILECAVEARADLIVTGNMKDIRPLGSFQGIEILTPREFLDKYFPTT